MLRKAVIPAAGLGTRMLPAAKAIGKEMLPVLDRPVIQHVVEECAAAGVDDVLLVTSRHKRALEDHFDADAELERRLADSGRLGLLADLAALAARVRIHSVRQDRQLGLGHAVLCAEAHVGEQPFLCLLGDAIFSGGPPPARQLLEAHDRLGGSIIGVEEVPLEKVSRYGIVAGREISAGILRVEALVEKPSPAAAPSRLAIAARYVLSVGIFACLRQTPPGAGGEIQLTDALSLLLQREPVHAVVLQARRHDIGNPLDWLRTNLIWARARPEVWQALQPLIEQLLAGAEGQA